MPATQAPYSQYFDKNGQPLDAGYVWFGLPNENPKTSPVNVYWDADLTQPALQPIRTLAGYLARNGSPAQVFTDGAYSQTVENKRFEMVYYAANSADYSDLPIRVAVITATDGQTLVNLPFAYTRGNNSLAIYLNGILLIKDKDYTETSTTSVTMIRPLKVGPGGADEVTAIGGRLINAASAIDAVSAAALASNTGATLVGTATGETLAERLGRLEFFTATPSNATADFTAFLLAGGGSVPDGVYEIDDITITNRVTVTGSADAIFKRRNTTSANSTMILFAAGSEDSVWDGPTVDGGRNTTVKAAFSAANPSYPGYWSGWFGVQSQAARINYRGKFTNHVSKPCWFAGDDNVIDIVCEDHGDAALFGYVWFSNGAVNRITPRPSGNGARRQSVKCISIRADNDGVAQVIQHAIDVQAAVGGSYDLRCYDLDGDTAGVSSYVSGITIENCEDCNLPLTLAHNFVSDTLQHLGVSLLGNTRCPLSVVSVQSIAGLAYEQNGNTDCPAALVMLDGAYKATTACPVGNDVSYGVSEYAGVWNVSRNSKSSQSNVRSDILGGTVQRFTRGVYLRTASVSLDSVNIVGNLKDGVLIAEAVFADHFTGAIAQKNRLTKLTNCVITCNGRAGISAESFKNFVLTGTRCYNNGQDTTLSTSVRVGLTASAGDLLQATGCQFGDDQSWTDTAACTYEPQASVNNFLTVYMQSTLGRLTVGQWITLVNGTGSGNVTAKIYATGVNDDVTLQTTGAVTLSATGNTTALTGTWSGSGTTLTGVGTAATTEIIGVTYVTNGTHWRRVLKATSATSIIIDTAFPSPLSGATLSKLLVNVSGIPSQQEGARVFSGVNKHFLGPDNTYDGNVLSRTVISDPLEAITGSVYFRKASVNPAALTVNLQTAIPARHRLCGVALNNDVAISGGGSTSYEVRLTNSGGTTLQTIATLVGLTKNTKVTAAVAASNQVADGNLLRVVFAGGAPTAGTITCEARYVVDGPQALPDAP